MAQILVRGLDEKIVERLKKRAKRGGRSLQSEVKMILENATQLAGGRRCDSDWSSTNAHSLSPFSLLA